MTVEELNRLHSIFLQSEVHCMVNAEVIAIRGNMALGIGKEIVKVVDKKSNSYKTFSLRLGAIENITRSALVYSNNTKKRIAELYGDEQIDDNVGSISGHINNLYSMDAEQIVSIMNCTEMVKGGHIPTYLNLESLEYQTMAQKTGIPYEYVVKIVNELQNFTISK